MKCIEPDEKLNLLLDGEAGERSNEIKSHLEKCKACRNELILQQTMRNYLKNLPPVLPENSFDNRMLRAFENHRRTNAIPAKNISVNRFVFSNPFLKFGSTAAVLAFGVGLAFIFGRMSAPDNQSVISSSPMRAEIKQSENQNSSAQIYNEQNTAPVEKEKIIIRYIKTLVVKEKIVEKRIYVKVSSKSIPRPQTNTFAQTKSKQSAENVAEQFNLKDLQPVSGVSYKIIRKGENNE